MIRTIADQYLAQNAGRRFPFRDDTALPEWLTDAGVLDFRCTLFDAPAGTVPEARLVNVAHTGDGNVVFAVDLSAGGVVVDTTRFTVPANIAGAPYTAYASWGRSTGALTVTGAAIPPDDRLPYDAEVEYIETDGVASYIDTGCNPGTVADRVIVSFKVISVPMSGMTGNNGNYIFGSCSTGLIWTERFGFMVRTGTNKFFGFVPTFNGELPDYDNNVHDIELSTSGTYFDGAQVSVAASTNAAYGSLCLGSRGSVLSNTNPQNYFSQTRFYSCKIYTDNVLVFDGIPVRFTNELGQSEGAMYDRVSKQLLRNAGAGSIGYGDDTYVPPSGEYQIDIPFAATTVVCDSLKVMSLQSGHTASDARDESDPISRNTAAVLSGEVILAEGRNAEPYLDGNRLRLDIYKGAGLGENCQAVVSGQTCDNVMFTINGERPGSDGNIRITGADGVTVSADADAHSITVKLDDVALGMVADECQSACNGG